MASRAIARIYFSFEWHATLLKSHEDPLVTLLDNSVRLMIQVMDLPLYKLRVEADEVRKSDGLTPLIRALALSLTLFVVKRLQLASPSCVDFWISLAKSKIKQ